MDKEIRANATPAPEIGSASGYYKFDESQYPAAGTYDPEFGIKKCKGLKGFASSICWLRKDKLRFYIKFNLGPYDWSSH